MRAGDPDRRTFEEKLLWTISCSITNGIESAIKEFLKENKSEIIESIGRRRE